MCKLTFCKVSTVRGMLRLKSLSKSSREDRGRLRFSK